MGDGWITIHHRGTGADLGVIRQCFEQGQYEIPEHRARYGSHADHFCRSVLAAGRTPLIVDCGANIGASVLWFAARYPGAHLVAIEPAADNFALLRRNCAGTTSDLRAAAVGPNDGMTLLYDPGEGAWGYRTGVDAAGGYEVAMLSLATILAENPASRYEPFILKIDIEGGEKELFSGDWTVIDRFPVLVIEPHDWILPGTQVASGFFRFHSNTDRDFAYRGENVFSLSYRRLVVSQASPDPPNSAARPDRSTHLASHPAA